MVSASNDPLFFTTEPPFDRLTVLSKRKCVEGQSIQSLWVSEYGGVGVTRN